LNRQLRSALPLTGRCRITPEPHDAARDGGAIRHPLSSLRDNGQLTFRQHDRRRFNLAVRRAEPEHSCPCRCPIHSSSATARRPIFRPSWGSSSN
jgi:hypothetical protein